MGYEKLLIFQFGRLMMDCWLIKSQFPNMVPSHVDPIPGYKHYRLNLILSNPEMGGEFWCFWPLLDWPRLKLFRSDFPHGVGKIWSGKRLVLSFGLALKDYHGL